MRRHAGTLALVLVSTLAGGLLLELAFRRLAASSFAPSARVFDRGWTVLLDCFPSNPRGYFDIDLRDPAVRSRYASVAPARLEKVVARAPWAVEFRYNRLRFREAEPAPKAGTRVVVMGDSFVEGQGVKAGDVITARLQSSLGAGFEVRNAGRRGTDFPEMNGLFEDALRYEPDVLVYAMTLNDPQRSAAFQSKLSYVNDWIQQRQAAPELVDPPPSQLVAFVKQRLQARRLEEETIAWYRGLFGAENADGWAATRAALRRMRDVQRERGGRFVVAVWPLLVDRNGTYPFAEIHETVRRACLEDGIEFLDLQPALAGVPVRELWVHEVDRHPNERAHARAAEALAPVVRSLAGVGGHGRR